ncbi:MAG: hypothetical protein PHV99_02465 [Candidatus Pacebacteria bacterium]|nr:hypothetical protein [Candidatus Paceibacterota bacterium]
MKNLFIRSRLNPIIRPQGSEWWKIYNPAAALDAQGRVHLFPRVMKQEEDWHSRIAHAVSNDGERFEWDKEPILVRQEKDEMRGLEDPRITLIDGTYYMTFAAYDGKKVMLHSATAEDLNGPWHRRGPMVPDFDFFKSGGRMVRWEKGKPIEKMISKRGSHWSKSGALFPQRIDGKLTLLFGEFYMWLATSVDGVKYDVETEPFLKPRKGTSYFDNTFIETGPPPILTGKGWLLLYHGIDEAFRYQLGFALLDKDNPRDILYRSSEPIFGLHEEYEVGDALIDVISGGVSAMSKLNDEELKTFYKKAREGNVMPQVTFCPGTVQKDGNLWLYYGAGDTSICTAWAPLEEILKIAS